MPPDLNDLAEKYVRCTDEYWRAQIEERIVEAAEPLIRSRCTSESLTREEKQDLAQCLRIAVIEAIRKWDPARNDRFSAFLVLMLQHRAYDFISSSSRIGYAAERRLSADLMDEREKRQAIAVRSTIPLHDMSQVGATDPDIEAIWAEESPDIFTEIAAHVDDPLLVETLRGLMEGVSRQVLRKRLRVSWPKLALLIQEAQELLCRWATDPPDWLTRLVAHDQD